MFYLDFGKNRHDGHNDAENHVEADEDLVLGAVVGLDVEQVEEHDGGESQGVVKNGEGQQRWEKREAGKTEAEQELLITYDAPLTLR